MPNSVSPNPNHSIKQMLFLAVFYLPSSTLKISSTKRVKIFLVPPSFILITYLSVSLLIFGAKSLQRRQGNLEKCSTQR